MNPPSAPSGRDSGRNLPPNGEIEHRADAFLAPRVLAREAAKLAADLKVYIPPARLRLLVTRFVECGRTDIDFRSWFIGYADPTGETAIRNVMEQKS